MTLPMTQPGIREVQEVLGLREAKQPKGHFYLVCIDLEAYEHNQDIITEIGVSFLSSSSIQGTDPGENGSAWFDQMQHLHLRPEEYRHLVNKNFIEGCPDAFNFGTSIFVKLADCGKILQRIFNDPSKLMQAANLDTPLADTKPKIAIVGHDLSNDTKFMAKLNFTPKNIAARFDTQRLSRPSKTNQPGLRKLLGILGIEATNLHNAGNDAAYTLQALVTLAVQEHHEPGVVGRGVEAAFASARSNREERKRKPKTFKEAREMAAQAVKDEIKPDQFRLTEDGRTGFFQRADVAVLPPLRAVPPVVRRIDGRMNKFVRRVGATEPAAGPRVSIDRESSSTRAIATSATDGYRTESRSKPGQGITRRERRKQRRLERARVAP